MHLTSWQKRTREVGNKEEKNGKTKKEELESKKKEKIFLIYKFIRK